MICFHHAEVKSVSRVALWICSTPTPQMSITISRTVQSMSRGDRYFAMASALIQGGTGHRFSWSVGSGLLTDDTKRSSVPPCSSLGRCQPARARQPQVQGRYRPILILLQLGQAFLLVEVGLDDIADNGRRELSV